MFNSDFQDSCEREVNVDCSSAALEIAVEFIYTKSISAAVARAAEFELWVEVFRSAQLMGVLELGKLGKLALWFSFAIMDQTTTFKVLEMCKEIDDCGYILPRVLDYMKTNWKSIPKIPSC